MLASTGASAWRTVELTGLSRNTLKAHSAMVETRLLATAWRRPEQEQLAFLNAHPDLYRRVDGRVRLNIKDGALALSSLAQTPGLAGRRHARLERDAADVVLNQQSSRSYLSFR